MEKSHVTKDWTRTIAVIAGSLLFLSACSGTEQSTPSPTTSETSTPYSSAEPSATNTSPSANGEKLTNGEKLLREAKEFEGLYFKWNGGRLGTLADFAATCPDPAAARNAPDNKPYGASSALYHNQNPSPCGVDVSSLIYISANKALPELNEPIGTVATIRTTPDVWREIPCSDVRRGDVGTRGPNTTAGIIEDVTSKRIIAFNAGSPGTQAGSSSYSVKFFDNFYRLDPGHRTAIIN